MGMTFPFASVVAEDYTNVREKISASYHQTSRNLEWKPMGKAKGSGEPEPFGV
jgi:hypothetical protein